MQTDSLKENYSLPQVPYSVCGNQNCFLPLTNRSKNDWSFLFEEIKDIPSAFVENQNYDFSSVTNDKWQSVIVPPSLAMQGFDIENNTEYYYKRTVEIPKAFTGNKIFIRFEGVYSNARVWVNNIFVGAHIGGFTPWDIDITDFAECKTITLILGVSDTEGDKVSPWNPNGEYQSDAAWASYYAHHNIGGILRDITMFCLPQRAVIKTHIDTFTIETAAEAKIKCTVTKNCRDANLKACISRNGFVVSEKTVKITSAEFEFSLVVPSADLW